MKQATVFSALIVILLLLFALVGSVALAMSSDNYRLDWFTPLTGSGGGAASSTNYAVEFTVGQVGPGTFGSANYDACLGYWCGAEVEYSIYLPLILKNR